MFRLFLLVLLCTPSLALAEDALDRVRARGELIWGGDAEGGGPYLFADPQDPGHLLGYDTLLAAELAKTLGVHAHFLQAGWDKLPAFLQAGQIDILTNGYEWTPERARQLEASLPYYIYGLRMLVRREETRLHDWPELAGLNGQRKWRAGVLGDSAAEFWLAKTYPQTVEIVKYEDSTTAMRDVAEGTLDLTVADTPIVQFFAPRFPQLRPQGAVVGKGYYVVYARKGETALIQAVNRALLQLMESGQMERIYAPYQLWNPQMDRELRCTANVLTHAVLGRDLSPEQVSAICAHDPPPKLSPPTHLVADATLPDDLHGWTVVTRYGPTLLQAATVTLLLSLLSFPLAVLLGLLLAIGRAYGPAWLRPLLGVYVEFVRGTPLMLQLFILYFFAVPSLSHLLGLDLTNPVRGFEIPLKSLLAAVLGLALNYAAYESEIYRAGLSAIAPGQMEAALSLGMSRMQALRWILLPQALRITLAPTINDFIALFKDTSVCSVIAVTELTKAYAIHSKNNPQAFVEFAALASVLYLAMSYPLALAARQLERKLAREM